MPRMGASGVTARFAPRLLAAALALTLCGACGDPTSPTTPTPTPPVAPAPDPLTIVCPAPITAGATSTAGAVVTYATPTTSGSKQPVSVVCAPSSGTVFPVGTTTARCTATDALPRTAACTFGVTITRPPQVPQISKTKFLAFGDSITAGEVTVPKTGVFASGGFAASTLQLVPAAAYPTVLGSLLVGRYSAQAQSLVVTNAGKPGENAADAVPRFIATMTTNRPEVVLLLDGYNDLTSLGAAGISNAANAVSTMAREARIRGARVFIANLTPSRPGSRAIATSTLIAYNNRIREVARMEGAVFVDLYAALLADVNTLIGIDGLHPNEAGYRKVADVFFAAIRSDLEAP